MKGILFHMHWILKILSAILILYGISIQSIHSGTKFFAVWYFLGVLTFLLSEIIRKDLYRIFSRPILYGFGGAICISILLVLCILAQILSAFHEKPDKEPEYLIVLGAQVTNGQPSIVLQYRLDEAAAYMKNHPKVSAVLSGGQGSNESSSEALVMRNYLLKKNLPSDKLITEEKSQNTKENLANSYQITGDAEVVIVSNNFHLWRAKKIAEKAGYSHVEGLSADSNPYFLVNNILREVLAIIKDAVVGNI